MLQYFNGKFAVMRVDVSGSRYVDVTFVVDKKYEDVFHVHEAYLDCSIWASVDLRIWQ